MGSPTPASRPYTRLRVRPRRPRFLGRGRVAWLVGFLLVLVGPGGAAAQGGGGDAGSTVAGVALGLYSGGVLGLTGSLMPCNRTLLGPRCAGVGSLVGGAIGAVAGGVMGDARAEAVRDRARGALYGTLVGGAVGIVLQQAVRQYAWTDALLVSAYGAAIGTAPRGVLIGAGVGALGGGLVWAVHRRDGISNLLLLTVVGSTLGGLADWAQGAADADGESGPRLVSSFSIPVG